MKTLYKNAVIYTGTGSPAEAFAVEDGRFVFVGSNAQADYVDADETVDLKGSFVCAGFNDSHMHLLNFGQALYSAPLQEHTGSLEDMLNCMRGFLAEHPVSEDYWLQGRGWNHDYFSDVQRMPDRHDLDSVSEDVPIVAVRCCGHCLAVNSKALELCGITAETQAPDGGAIGMEGGQPDGRFYDEAMELVYSHIPVPGKSQIKDMLRLASTALSSFGVTSSQTDDYCVFRNVPWQTVNEAYRELIEEGALTVRVYEQSNFTDIDSLRDFVEAGCVTGAGDDMFKIGPLKMLGDGSLGARTAFLSRPYADDPSTCGFALFTQQQFDEMIGYANAHGMQVAVHSIGDASMDMILDAVERALAEHPRSDHRHGIVHCQITRQDQLERLARMNMHIYAQSIFLDYDNHIIEDRVGPELAATSYCWKTLMKMGVSVSNGTDCPVELPDALAGMQCAVTRTTLRDNVGPYLQDEAFTVKEALDSYTVRGAEASFEENVKGKIAPGFLADFTVLGQDPFAADPSAIKDIPVLATYLGGRQVYRAE